MIYLDHQSTTRPFEEVLSAMAPFFGAEFGNPHSNDHWVGWRSNEALEKSRLSVAEFLNVSQSEIIFTSGATESNNQSILGLKNIFFGQNEKVAVSAIEHKCVLEAAAEKSKSLSTELTEISVSEFGAFDEESLVRALKEGVKFCSIMFANNEIGTVNDIELASKLCKQFGSLLHCDAAQAGLYFDLKNLSEYADLISISAHKIGGPMGVGALYISQEISHLIEPIIRGGGQERGMRSGTVALPLAAGFAAACEKLRRGSASARASAASNTRDYLASQLLRLDAKFKINGPPLHNRHPANLNICFGTHDAQVLLSNLQPHVAASQGSACSSGFEEPSHVLRKIGLTDNDAKSSVRFSVGLKTTKSEIDEALVHIKTALENSCL